MSILWSGADDDDDDEGGHADSVVAQPREGVERRLPARPLPLPDAQRHQVRLPDKAGHRRRRQTCSGKKRVITSVIFSAISMKLSIR